ncbi:hypothetical protein RhiXN_01892 [Rhizoctonia solani]|uniref:Uncharacterized protein n=1 Tax=Rhizoctonia solani TaxID=456999 RepID=A0A8H8T402_9AGAM|nr:uncharacterized protein RhiXN_01892 [Rhizoctonia solani]QRW27297.1 hypothetical protein RhiXN_01892 [Rhizoctonia solani]
MNPASGDGIIGSKYLVPQASMMTVQPTMNAAMSTLSNSVGRDKKHKIILNKIHDILKALEADELSGSEIVEHGARLVEVMPESIASLHKTFPRPTLAFCAATVGRLFEAKLEPTLERSDEGSAKAWEDIIFRGFMEPILSIVDSEDQDVSVVGDVMCQVICGIMRSSWTQSFGGRFARSLALTLLYTCSSPSNKVMLLDPSIFGVETLSKLIIDAKDYLHLDTLLELSFTMFSSKSGKLTRKAYADSLFGSRYALERLPDEISNELASIHSVTNGGNSEKHVLDIMRTMSTAGIERHVARPQLFMTKDLSYCGTQFTQTPPSNVIILDYENLCIVFCDKNGDNDVLIITITTVKNIELISQDASRIIVELEVTEPPLISSSREVLAIPDTHIPGSPLKTRLSIASPDIFGLKAALAARDLGSILNDNSTLIRHSSLASTKISNAIFSVHLKKNRNPSNLLILPDFADVNLPSSRDSSPPTPTEPTEFAARAAQPRSLLQRISAVPDTAMRAIATPELKESTNVVPSTLHPTASPGLRSPATAPTETSTAKTVGPAPTRTKRVAAEKSQRATKLATLAYADESELTDVDPEDTPEHSESQTTTNNQAGDAPILPTPPRTRARVRQMKPVGKTLVPSTPTADELPEVYSPPDLPSPSPRPARKRKLVGDDPFELPPLSLQRPAKQKKTTNVNVVSSSQRIQPRRTTAIRARVKYGAVSKRMQVSSPIESIHSADTEAGSSPHAAPVFPRRKNPKATLIDNKTTARIRSRLDKSEDCGLPKRQTRASATNAKLKLVDTVEEARTSQNKDAEQCVTNNAKLKPIEASEPPKRKRGRPPKNKLAQKPVELLEATKERVALAQQPDSQPEYKDLNASDEARPTHVDERAEMKSIYHTDNQAVATSAQEEIPENDDLLERLSQAAKKALKPLAVDDQSTGSIRHSSNPIKTPEIGIEMEDPDMNPEVVDMPVRESETCTPEDTTYQTQDTTTKPVEKANILPTKEFSDAPVEEESPSVTAPTKPMAWRVDIHKDYAPKCKDHTNAIGGSTRALVSRNAPTDSLDSTPVDATRTNEFVVTPARPIITRAQEALCQQDATAMPLKTHSGVYLSASRKRESLILPETPTQHHYEKITKRIHPDKKQAAMKGSPVQRVEVPPAKYQHQTKLPQGRVPMDSVNSQAGMEPSQEFTSRQPNSSPIRRPSVLASRPLPTSRPIINSHLHEALTSAKIKHAAITRVLFDTGAQPSPKSALASPQRRTLANGTRPSVSFLDPPVPLSRRGSSGSSTEGVQNFSGYRIDREGLRGGHSARSGDSILQIADKLTEIQELIVLSLGEKVQRINADARKAHIELTKGVVEELSKMQAESESHHEILHKFESTFASQTQVLFDGFGRVSEFDDRINIDMKNILTANARDGQSIAGSALYFQIPELFSALLAS